MFELDNVFITFVSNFIWIVLSYNIYLKVKTIHVKKDLNFFKTIPAWFELWKLKKMKYAYNEWYIKNTTHNFIGSLRDEQI